MKNINYKNKPLLIITLGSLLILGMTGCKKFLDAGIPIDKVPSKSVYESDINAASVLTGIYSDLQAESTGFAQGRTGVSFFCGIAADELNVLPLSAYATYYNNDECIAMWGFLYQFIYRINAAIEGVSLSAALSTSVKEQLLGECKFLRAFCYFYLVNLYGDVPLAITTDYKINASLSREKVEKVYDQIISDLLYAQIELKDYFVAADAQSQSNDRIRPSKWAAIALLSRVYLYIGNWEKAEEMAGIIINNKMLFDTVALENVFLKNSKEAIWQLQTVDNGGNTRTQDANLFILINGEPDDYLNPCWLRTELLNSFEKGDRRKDVWINVDSTKGNYYYPFKYRYVFPDQFSSEYLMVFRVAEQYLIRAEALSEQGKIEDAKKDLDVLRHRAGVPRIDVGTTTEMKMAILRERRVELFTEWGHRWFDLKRMGKIDEVLSQTDKLRSGSWEPYKKLWSIPVSEIALNKNIIQNSGYPSK